MAGNGIQVDSLGRIKVKNNGIVVAGAGDPCCCEEEPTPGNECGHMTNAPLQWMVTIAGWTACGCGDVSQELDVDINGTWTLTQDGVDPCKWTFVTDTIFIGWYYSSVDCTGTPVEVDGTVEFVLVRNAGSWHFTVRAITPGDPDERYFTDTNTTEPSDGSDFTLTNEASDTSSCGLFMDPGDVTSDVRTAYGGTAAFSAI